MPTPITVPRLGWSMEEGTFLGWLKQEGDVVKSGEPLFTLENEKAAQEVEATETGILRIAPEAPQVGATVAVGALLGYLLAENETVPPAGTPPPPTPPAPKPAPPASPTQVIAPSPAPLPSAEPAPLVVAAPVAAAPVTVSPRARRQARTLGVDYRTLKGSGRTGRIIEADVLAAARVQPGSTPSSMRRTIAERTASSFAQAPHFYLRTEIDATALVALRERLLPDIQATSGVRITLSDLFLRAQALALRDCPFANVVWQDDQLVTVPKADVGLVVGLKEGLMIPIIREPAGGDLAALAQQRDTLVQAARAGRLSTEAMQGGATSLSNLGATRVDEFAAVIAPGQSSILAVGRLASRPWVVDGTFAVRPSLKLCLSVDHRVMDGGPAAEFLGRIAALLEAPAALTGG
jgi:pyruvate dehydrogenase E2 component (dihydrolipoamide acetyltransferase)